MRGDALITRRSLLGRAAALGAGTTLVAGPAAIAKSTRPGRRPVPLPTPQQIRRDFTTMVQFGPRLTATPQHDAYIGWLEDRFVQAGLELIPCDTYTTDRWLAQEWSLDLLEGASAGPVPVAAYYPRSQQTPAAGVTGPLVYGGVAPALSVSGTDLTALMQAIAAYPQQLASWIEGVSGTIEGVAGSILLVDRPIPPPLTAAVFLPLSTYLSWPGHTLADWATSDYKRTWIEPGLGIPLNGWQEAGAAAVVFAVDASAAALAGGYLPFGDSPQPLPALHVDRQTGEGLRAAATARPSARLTLAGTVQETPVQALTAVLPGSSDETLIFNTHTDAQGFAEENGGVAFTQLARHFASLPRNRRLRRTLVFAAWPGHMASDLPQTQGWIDAHPDLVERAAAAMTVEHLGCTEWIDTLDGGYHATGLPEMFAVWTTQGKMFELTRDSVAAHRLPRTALMRPPVQFGVGAAFQSSGVPQIGAIAGPEYLVTISENGDLDKLDEHLAARQIAWLADLARRIDGVPAAQLRKGDPTLGVGAPSTSSSPAPTEEACSA
jgi:hypothetical protein